MNFNHIEYDRKYLFYGIILIIIVLIILSIINVLNPPSNKPLPENKEIENIIQDDNLDEVKNDDLMEISQEEVISVLKVYVDKVKDLSTRIDYDILLGTDENKISSSVRANLDTIYFDFKNEVICSPSAVKEGSTIVLYSTGNYSQGNLIASVIGVGDDTSYALGTIGQIQRNDDGTGIFSLQNEEALLEINKNCIILNGFTGDEIHDLILVTNNSRILYKYSPDFEITNRGNLYSCTKIIVLGEYQT